MKNYDSLDYVEPNLIILIFLVVIGEAESEET